MGERSVFRALVALVSMVLLGACGGGLQVEPTPTLAPTLVAVEKPVYSVQRGPVVRSLVFDGRVAPVDEQALYFQRDGRIGVVHVEPGDTVGAGDVLLELEQADLAHQLAQARLVLQTAEANLASATQADSDALFEANVALEKALLRMQQVEVRDYDAPVIIAGVRLEQAIRSVSDAQAEYDQALDRPWEPENVVDSYARALQSAQQRLTIARADHDQAIANRAAHEYEIALLDQDVSLARYRAERLQQVADPQLALAVEKAQLDLDSLQAQQSERLLVAPADGQVLALTVRPGDQVSAYDEVLVIGDSSRLEILAQLGTVDLAELGVGQPATVVLRNRPGETLLGSVRLVPFSQGYGNDNTVRIVVEQAGDLQVGELATVEVILEQREDALWLPTAALRTYRGRDFVVIQDGSRQQRVDVQVGVRGEDRIEILAGLVEGQLLVGP